MGISGVQPEMEMVAKSMACAPFNPDGLSLLDGLAILREDGFQMAVYCKISAPMIQVDMIAQGGRHRENVGDSFGGGQNRIILIIGGIEIQVESS